jgi:hypothetical protein
VNDSASLFSADHTQPFTIRTSKDHLCMPRRKDARLSLEQLAMANRSLCAKPNRQKQNPWTVVEHGDRSKNYAYTIVTSMSQSEISTILRLLVFCFATSIRFNARQMEKPKYTIAQIDAEERQLRLSAKRRTIESIIQRA